MEELSELRDALSNAFTPLIQWLIGGIISTRLTEIQITHPIIVSDDVEPGPGQIRETDFLDELGTRLNNAQGRSFSGLTLGEFAWRFILRRCAEIGRGWIPLEAGLRVAGDLDPRASYNVDQLYDAAILLIDQTYGMIIFQPGLNPEGEPPDYTEDPLNPAQAAMIGPCVIPIAVPAGLSKRPGGSSPSDRIIGELVHDYVQYRYVTEHPTSLVICEREYFQSGARGPLLTGADILSASSVPRLRDGRAQGCIQKAGYLRPVSHGNI
jgi:hypothetical protein